jgi:prepilin-type N-terminal cleavage/methylation domain-containing protein
MVRTPDPGNRLATRSKPPAQAGFSLVEVLVTLSVSAMAATLILTTTRPADPLRKEGEQLAKTIEQLDGRARISGSPLGLVVEPNHYTSVIWTGEQWSELTRQSHTLTSGVFFKLPAGTGTVDDERLTPQMVFDPLGHSKLEPLVLLAKGRELAVALPDKQSRRTK